MKIEIEIKKSDNENLCACVNGLVLFEFDYREYELNSWLFWLGYSPLHPKSFKCAKSEFPMEFFKNACRAKYFFTFDELPEDAEIVDGIDLLK